MVDSFKVNSDFHNTRLDKWFVHNIKNLPHSLIEKLIRTKKIKVNNKKVKSSYRLNKGDIIRLFGIGKYAVNKVKEKEKYLPSNKDLNILANIIIENNDNFIVINKPNGIAVQSGTNSFKNLNDILKRSIYFNNSKPFIVHRLDKETSGIMIFAKNRSYAQLFTSLFRIRKIHKTYHAVVKGNPEFKKKVLEDNLEYYDNNGDKYFQKAITNVKVLKNSNGYSILELIPVTGRKHQLRRQLFNIGFPIVGDKKYKIKKNNKVDTNLLLHAHSLKFMIKKLRFNYKAAHPDYFENYLKSIIS
tara:strand:- start:808 stop:1710 length:903 start_codon:yes stop_codon:yes gene_type:complete